MSAVSWPGGVLNRDKTLEVLTQHNAWRRGADGPQTDPRMLGLALDAAIAALSAPAEELAWVGFDWAAGCKPAAAAVPEGYALVPVEPTEAMRAAHAMYGDTSDWWSTVLAAATQEVR